MGHILIELVKFRDPHPKRFHSRIADGAVAQMPPEDLGESRMAQAGFFIVPPAAEH